MRLSTKKLDRARSFVHRTVISHWKTRHRPGEIGLELEVEGVGLMDAPDPDGTWTKIKDGSLRGDSAEFILTAPILRKNLRKSLEMLSDYFKENRIRFMNSYRTSVHVHINMQKQKMLHVVNFVVLYSILEPLLVNKRICGESRVGNVFCLRFSDAEYPINSLKQSILYSNGEYLRDDARLKYSALNLATLTRFGSLEFRAMQGTTDIGVIEEWVNTLLCLKDAALQYDTPNAIAEEVSGIGVDHFLTKVFGGDRAQALIRQVDGDYRDEIFRNLQEIQDLCYLLPDWSEPPQQAQVEEDAPQNIDAIVERMFDIDRMEAPAPPLMEEIAVAAARARNDAEVAAARARLGLAQWAFDDRAPPRPVVAPRNFVQFGNFANNIAGDQ